MIWIKKYNLEELNAYIRMRGLCKLLNISITDIGDDYLFAQMPVTPDLLQVQGILHGGATCVLVETVGSIASGLCLDQAKQFSVGSQIQVNHIRQTTSGAVQARCVPIHLGKQKHVWDIPVYAQETGKLIAKGELTCFVLNKE